MRVEPSKMGLVPLWRDFPGGSVIKSLLAKAGNARDVGLTPGSGRSPGRGNGNLFQYSCLKNSKDRGAWQATVHGFAKSLTQLSIYTLMEENSAFQSPEDPAIIHLWTKQKALTRHHFCHHLDLGRLSLWNCEKYISVVYISHLVYGILLKKPKQTKTWGLVNMVLDHTIQPTSALISFFLFWEELTRCAESTIHSSSQGSIWNVY